jgi:DNA-binding response OmpR family regulator
MERVLLVDSNLQLTQTLHEHLSSEYEVATCAPKDLPAHFENFQPEVIFFCSDEVLFTPETLKAFAPKCKTLVVIKSSSDHRMQMLLDMGITDWLVEPLNFDELNWKLRFLLRKRKGDQEAATFELATLKVQPHEHRVVASDRNIIVTPIQMRLLIAFHSFPNRLMSRDWLRFKVWNGEPMSLRSIDAHISKLKKLLPEIEPYVESVYGKGYVWKTEPSQAKVS